MEHSPQWGQAFCLRLGMGVLGGAKFLGHPSFPRPSDQPVGQERRRRTAFGPDAGRSCQFLALRLEYNLPVFRGKRLGRASWASVASEAAHEGIVLITFETSLPGWRHR